MLVLWGLIGTDCGGWARGHGVLAIGVSFRERYKGMGRINGRQWRKYTIFKAGHAPFLDNVFLNGRRHRFRDTVHVQLFVDAADVVINRVDGDEQLGRDHLLT